MGLTIVKYILHGINGIIASNYFIIKTKEDNTTKNIAKQIFITLFICIISSILITLLFDLFIPYLPNMVNNKFQQMHEVFNQLNATN